MGCYQFPTGFCLSISKDWNPCTGDCSDMLYAYLLPTGDTSGLSSPILTAVKKSFMSSEMYSRTIRLGRKFHNCRFCIPGHKQCVFKFFNFQMQDARVAFHEPSAIFCADKGSPPAGTIPWYGRRLNENGVIYLCQFVIVELAQDACGNFVRKVPTAASSINSLSAILRVK